MLVANTNHLDLGKAVESVTTWEDFAQNVEIAQSRSNPTTLIFYPKLMTITEPFACMPLPCLTYCHYKQRQAQTI